MKKLLWVVVSVLFIIGLYMIITDEPVAEAPVVPTEGVRVDEVPEVFKEAKPTPPAPKVEKKVINTTATINGRVVNISWVLDNTPLENCRLEPSFARACYSEVVKTVYVSQEIKSDKDLIFYHEIAHFLYLETFPKDIFKAGPFGPDYEVIANDFAWWIIGQKKPSQRAFVDEVISRAKQDYFASTCDSACVSAILGIKIK